MNDEFDSKGAIADEWEMSLPEIPSPENSANSVTVQSEAEDWGMTNPLTPPPPNQPNAPDASGWKLPEPLFRTSEGSAPKKIAAPAALPAAEKPVDFSAMPAPPLPPPSNEVQTDDSDAPPAPTAPAAPFEAQATPPIETQATAPPAASASAAAVEPQPDISEQLIKIPPQILAAPAVKTKSKTLRIISVAAGLLAMLGFVVGFLVLIYFLFFKNTAAQ